MLVASAFANDVLARDEEERELGVYIADPEDAEAMAKPASRLLVRRMREDGVLSPDLADAIAALVALASYVGKVLHRRTQLRRSRAGFDEPTPAETTAPAA